VDVSFQANQYIFLQYVGESERAVRACFQRARNSAPCVIFFDEFDSLCPKRSDGGDGNNSGTRIVNQLLTEMDGVEERKGVYILAATNRPDIIDPAILRPGRLDTILYVGLPEQSERAEILKATTKVNGFFKSIFIYKCYFLFSCRTESVLCWRRM